MNDFDFDGPQLTEWAVLAAVFCALGLLVYAAC